MLSKLKTVSPVILVAGIVLIIVVSAIFLIIKQFQSSNILYLGDGTAFDVKIAYTEEERVKGYGRVEVITEKDALLLAFPSDDYWKITMKDMELPIDIVWLDKDKKVVYIVKQAPFEGGAGTIYTPKVKARYVVEMKAGSVDRKKITIGRSAVFDINKDDIK